MLDFRQARRKRPDPAVRGSPEVVNNHPQGCDDGCVAMWTSQWRKIVRNAEGLVDRKARIIAACMEQNNQPHKLISNAVQCYISEVASTIAMASLRYQVTAVPSHTAALPNHLFPLSRFRNGWERSSPGSAPRMFVEHSTRDVLSSVVQAYHCAKQSIWLSRPQSCVCLRLLGNPP